MPYTPGKINICHDCGAAEGKLHKPGCDMEVCPFCYGQMITCDCIYEKLGIDLDAPENADVYNNGPRPEHYEVYDKMLAERGLIPYLAVPFFCIGCGEIMPEPFHANDWRDVMPPEYQSAVLCRHCYETIRRISTVAKRRALLNPQRCLFCGTLDIPSTPQAGWDNVMPPNGALARHIRFGYRVAACDACFAFIKEHIFPDGWRAVSKPGEEPTT